MASDWRKKREEEDEKEREYERAKAPANSAPILSGPEEGRVDELLRLIDPLIEQVNSLYTQFIAGVEKRPPLETRVRLDKAVEQLTALAKPTSSARFRSTSLIQKYLTHRDRWERMMKELETGRRRGG